MKKKRSNFVTLIYEICAEEGIDIRSFSDEWCHRLEKDGDIRFIVGYQFPVNNAASKEVCQDKVLTYEVLTDAGVPAAVHRFLPGGSLKNPEEACEITEYALGLLEKDGRLVLKDNYGTGGNRVYLIEDEKHFYEVLETILKSSYAASVSPFYEIEEEYRVVMADGTPGVVFRKERAFDTDENGEKHYLNWKHNLGQGAKGVPETDPEVLKTLIPLAEKTAETLKMCFCSVDIIRTGGEYLVLEVNGGVMMEHFSGQDENCRRMAKETYRKMIRKMFGE